MSEIKIMRIYDSYDANGYRILVDRVWPRGVSKEKARLDLWAKEIAPTKELRTWFNHEDDKFSEFREKYLAEIQQNPDTDSFLKNIKMQLTKSDVLLLFSAKNIEHNQAVVLLEYIKKELA